MIHQSIRLACLGFGEAAAAFVAGWRSQGYAAPIRAYDIADRSGPCAELGVTPVSAPRDLGSATHVICAVTADQQRAAVAGFGALREDQFFLDVNSVAPDKKVAAGAQLGPGYVDVAVLSPVLPRQHQVPILASGPSAGDPSLRLAELFPNSQVFSPALGDASQFKLIRSIFVKGVEAVAAECALAAQQAGLADRIFPSLDLVLDHPTARSLADYSMERVARHGARRAAEMQEACAMLKDLGLPSPMSQGAASMQALIGELGLTSNLDDAGQIAKQALAQLS